MNKAKQKAKRLDKSVNHKDDSGSIDVKSTMSGSPLSTPASTPGGPTPQASPLNKTAPTLWFANEIQHMMHGFGDCRKPLAESAALIEQITHQQLVQLLHQASEVGAMRNARFLSIEDFLFLLRKDKVKLRRLLKYMSLKDLKATAFKAAIDEEEGSDQQGESKPPVRKKRRICYDFLSSIDQTGELVALFDDEGVDEIKQERALRAELQSRKMDSQQYIDYCESRQASFTPRYKSQKFKDWLLSGLNLELKPNPLAIEVLSYLAYETVAQIVDMSLIVKRDERALTDSAFDHAMPPVCVNHEIPMGPQPPQSPAASKSPSTATSPVTSPPGTPTTPSPMCSPPSGATTPATPQSANNSAVKTKAKKRKKKKVPTATLR